MTHYTRLAATVEAPATRTMSTTRMPTLSFRGPTTPVTEFAFRELRKFFDRTPSVHNLRDIQFGIIAGDRDGFEFRLVGSNRLQVLAANDRSCLYAAYAFLEAVGWRFPAPGADHLDDRAVKPAGWKHLAGPTEAAFEWRGLSVASSSPAEVAALIEWMPKVRLNSLFIGHTAGGEPLRDLLPDLADRSIRVEAGGDLLGRLLPRDLFARHPEYFRMQAGERRPDGNFCTSRFGALQIVAEQARQYAQAWPAASVFQFRGDAPDDRGWCQCSLCDKLTPTEQMLAAINAIATALATDRATATVNFLLMHDTGALPPGLHPAPNVMGLFAPRDRCYAHGLGDPQCAHNAWYATGFEAARKTFGGRLSALGFYADVVPWRYLGVAVPATILADLRWYRSKGLEQIQAMHCGRISDWLYPLNTYVFARAAWDAELSHDTVVPEFARARYGKHARLLLPVLGAVEQASVNALSYCGYDQRADDLRHPPSQPAVFVQEHLGRLQEAVTQTEQALAKLPATDHPAVAADRRLLELNCLNLRALGHQMRHEIADGVVRLTDLQQGYAALPAWLVGAWQTPVLEQLQALANELQTAPSQL